MAAFAAASLLFTLSPAAPSRGEAPPKTKVRELTATIHREHVFALPMHATHVAVHWPGRPDAEVEIAFSTDGESFGPEEEVEIDEVGEARRDGRTYGAVMAVSGVKAVRITTDRPLPQAAVLVLDTGKLESGWGFGASVAAAPQPPVISRAQWGANEALRFDTDGAEIWEREFYPIQKLVVHHTAGRNNDPDPAATVRAIYYYHAVTQGWGDIGYNFMIDEAGRVYEGRYSRPYLAGAYPTGTNQAGDGVVGGHARTYNAGTVGIGLLGNFEERAPTSAARAALVRTLAWSAALHGVYPRGATTYVNPINGNQRTFRNISGHGDLNPTACPGEALYALLPAIRDQVAAELVRRVAGPNRYATAAAISAAGFSPNVPVAYVATGEQFPDALGAGPVAARQGGPVLLVRPSSIPSETAAELSRLRPLRIVVVGGSGVVSNAVEQQLAAYQHGGGVRRVAGPNRYATAAAISAAGFSPNVPVAYVATGEQFPDALGAGPVAARQGGPVLLVRPSSIPSETAAELSRLRPLRIVVVGGSGVVSDSVANALKKLAGG